MEVLPCDLPGDQVPHETALVGIPVMPSPHVPLPLCMVIDQAILIHCRQQLGIPKLFLVQRCQDLALALPGGAIVDVVLASPAHYLAGAIRCRWGLRGRGRGHRAGPLDASF